MGKVLCPNVNGFITKQRGARAAFTIVKDGTMIASSITLFPTWRDISAQDFIQAVMELPNDLEQSSFKSKFL
jgi:hypothetical protein